MSGLATVNSNLILNKTFFTNEIVTISIVVVPKSIYVHNNIINQKL